MAFLDALRVFFPKSKRRKRPKKRPTSTRQAGAGAFVPAEVAAAHGVLKVLIADLAGGSGSAAAERISRVLTQVGGVDAYRRATPLAQPNVKALLDRLGAAAEEGRAWLAEEQCDLLIWGEVEQDGAQHRLRYLAAHPGAASAGMGLGDSLALPAGDTEEAAALIAAAALAAAGPGHQGLRKPILELLLAKLAELDRLIETPPPTFDATQQASALVAIGNAYAAAAQMGGGELLDRALIAYRAAGARIPRASQPVDWAMAAHHAAAVHELKGRKTKDAEPLRQAAQLYRDAAEALGRDANPMDWALAHVRLGMVLYRLAGVDLTHPTQHLKDAAAAFEEALTVYDRQAAPGRWAEVMNHHGVTLMALGEQVTGTVALEQAIDAFKKSLEVRKREHAPLLWAQTANNLGAASFALAKRTGAAPALREAAGYFEASADEFRRHPGYGKRAQVIESNLGRVQRLLQARGVG